MTMRGGGREDAQAHEGRARRRPSPLFLPPRLANAPPLSPAGLAPAKPCGGGCGACACRAVQGTAPCPSPRAAPRCWARSRGCCCWRAPRCSCCRLSRRRAGRGAARGCACRCCAARRSAAAPGTRAVGAQPPPRSCRGRGGAARVATAARAACASSWRPSACRASCTRVRAARLACLAALTRAHCFTAAAACTVYLPDEHAYLARAADPASSLRAEWGASCRAAHGAGWRHALWDFNASARFLGQHYAAYLPTWLAYKDPVCQADALRALLMRTLGGVYLDLDVECFRCGVCVQDCKQLSPHLARQPPAAVDTGGACGERRAASGCVPASCPLLHPVRTSLQAAAAAAAAVGGAAAAQGVPPPPPRPAEEVLAGWDLVLQGNTPAEPLTNAVLASVPGHPLWDRVLTLLQERGCRSRPVHPQPNGASPLWRRVRRPAGRAAPRRRRPRSPEQRGRLGGGALVERHAHQGAPAGQVLCAVRLERRRVPQARGGEGGGAEAAAAGATAPGDDTTRAFNSPYSLPRRGLALQRAAGTAPPHLAGWHRFSASWLEGGNPEGVFSEEGVERLLGAKRGKGEGGD